MSFRFFVFLFFCFFVCFFALFIDLLTDKVQPLSSRDQAHRQLALMFETQVGLLRAQLLQLHHHHNNDDNDDDEEVREHVTDLQMRLSERDAALKVLREELRQRNKARATATAGAAAVTPPPTMTALEALDVGVMALRVSRTEAERTSMALQLTMGQVRQCLLYMLVVLVV